MSLHVAITGATGFIGAAIVADLLACGRRVTVLLRPESDLTRLLAMRGFETLAYSNLLDDAVVRDLRERKPDVFIHCGWRGVGGADRNEMFQITENVPTTVSAVELAAAAGCRQWIGLGSQAEYGNQNCRISETDALHPSTRYGRAKLAAGRAALSLCEAHRIAGAWLRVFSTYGPGDAPHWLIPYVIQEFLGGRPPRLTACEQRWDYLYVADAAQAVVSVANGVASGVFNLGSGSARPLIDFIEAIRREVGSPVEPIYGAVPYRADQVMHLEADTSRLTAATGWRARTSIAEGIRGTVAYELKRAALAAVLDTNALRGDDDENRSLP